MATASGKAPKQWTLSKEETLNSYDNWKENLLYTLSLDKNFAPFLKDTSIWTKASSADPNRGLVDDETGTADAKTKMYAIWDTPGSSINRRTTIITSLITNFLSF